MTISVTDRWLEKLRAEKNELSKLLHRELLSACLAKDALPHRDMRQLKALLLKFSATVHTHSVKKSERQSNLCVLEAIPLSYGAVEGVELVSHLALRQAKYASWSMSFSSSFIQRHALDRLEQRASADERMFRDGLSLIGLVSQIFNSVLCLGYQKKLPLLLPFQDGLFLGQSDLSHVIAPGSRFDFDKRGAKSIPLAQPKVAVLLGNPPRSMVIRTFVGGADGLTNRKSKAHSLLSDFFNSYDGLLRRFSEKVLFNFDQEDFLHAVSVDFERTVSELWAHVKRIQTGVGDVSTSEGETLEAAFRDPAELVDYRNLLFEYQALLKNQAIQDVIERSARHLR